MHSSFARDENKLDIQLVTIDFRYVDCVPINTARVYHIEYHIKMPHPEKYLLHGNLNKNSKSDKTTTTT